jgi:hypothetical protein
MSATLTPLSLHHHILCPLISRLPFLVWSYILCLLFDVIRPLLYYCMRL